MRVRNCNLPAGLGFYALLPVGDRPLRRARRRARRALLPAPRASDRVPAARGVGAWTLARLYRDPAVFAFDPFGGYFPGPIYDEALRPPLRLLLYRVANLVWIAPRSPYRRGPRARPRSARLAAPAAGDRGGAAGRERRALRARRPAGLPHAARRPGARAAGRAPHGSLRAALRPRPGLRATDMALTARGPRVPPRATGQRLGAEPRGPITVCEFPNAETKKAIVGAGNTLYAKPVDARDLRPGRALPVAAPAPRDGARVRRRVRRSAVRRALAWRWRGPFPVPMLASGLIEGVAEAADAGAPDGTSTIHQEAAAMIADGRGAAAGGVVGAGFSTLSGARAYTLAGSFCRFLLETRGAEKLRGSTGRRAISCDVYRTRSPTWRRVARHAGRQRLDGAGSRAGQRAVPPTGDLQEGLRARAGARLGEARAVMRVEPERAIALLEETCADDPHEPIYRLALGEAWAAAGKVPARDRHAGAPGRRRRPDRADAGARGQPLGTLYFLPATSPTPRQRSSASLELAPDEGERRNGAREAARAGATGRAPDAGARALRRGVGRAGDPVLVFFLISEFARLYPRDRLGPYLIGRQLLMRDPAHALPFCSAPAVKTPGAPTAAPARRSAARVHARMPTNDRRGRLPRRRFPARARGRAGPTRRQRSRGRARERPRHGRTDRVGRAAAARALTASGSSRLPEATRPRRLPHQWTLCF